MPALNHTTNVETLSVVISTNLSNKSGYLATIANGSNGPVAALAAAATAPLFVINDDGDGSSNAITGSVIRSGVALVKLGGSVSAGARITSDSSGKGVTASSGNFVAGVALADGVSNDLIPVLVTPGVTA